MKRLLTIPLLLATATLANPATTTAPATPPARYLSADQAGKILADDAYLSLLNPIEASAKTGKPLDSDKPADLLPQLRKRYAAAALDFTPEERDTLDWYTAKLDAALVNYPLLTSARTPFRFIKVAPTLENSFPHTRADCIVLTERRIAALAAARKSDPDRAIFYAGVLLHERTHILQRNNPKLFADLYAAWGYTHIDNDKEKFPLGDLAARQITNPDATDPYWLLESPEGKPRYVLALFAFATPPAAPPTSFARSHILLVDVKKTDAGYTLATDDLGKPKIQFALNTGWYLQRFDPSIQLLHPNEIFADLFTQLVLEEIAGPAAKPLPKTPTLTTLRTWTKKNLQ